MNDPVKLMLLWLVAVNVTGFALMGIDKGKARHGAWRISEKSLFLPALLGGTPGVIAGMWHFHHKTRHWYFRYGLPVLLTLQLGAAAWLAYKGLI